MPIVRLVLWLLIASLVAMIVLAIPTFGIIASGISILGALIGGALLDTGMRRL